MAQSEFVYVTFIRTTPEKLWRSLIEPEFTRQFWIATTQESEWKPGSPWRLVAPDGRILDSGEVLEIEPPKRLVLKWRHHLFPEMAGDGDSIMTYEIEKKEDSVKLTVTHVNGVTGSRFIKGVSNGWPQILSSLKSLLETGESLESTRHWPKGM
jgi:uncharacterized protein YndB with AHSA1/START domain